MSSLDDNTTPAPDRQHCGVTFAASLLVLCLGVFLAAIARSIGMPIFARIVQGSGGAIFPLAFGIIRDEFGGGLGIVFAGPVIDSLDYHWLFWLPLVAVAAATVATLFFVPESPVRSPGRIDWLGSLLLSAWLVLLLLGISQTARWGWGDPRVIALIAAGLLAALASIAVPRRPPPALALAASER